MESGVVRFRNNLRSDKERPCGNGNQAWPKWGLTVVLVPTAKNIVSQVANSCHHTMWEIGVDAYNLGAAPSSSARWSCWALIENAESTHAAQTNWSCSQLDFIHVKLSSLIQKLARGEFFGFDLTVSLPEAIADLWLLCAQSSCLTPCCSWALARKSSRTELLQHEQGLRRPTGARCPTGAGRASAGKQTDRCKLSAVADQ